MSLHVCSGSQYKRLKAQIIDQSEQSEQRVTDGAFISNIECEDYRNQEW